MIKIFDSSINIDMEKDINAFLIEVTATIIRMDTCSRDEFYVVVIEYTVPP